MNESSFVRLLDKLTTSDGAFHVFFPFSENVSFPRARTQPEGTGLIVESERVAGNSTEVLTRNHSLKVKLNGVH